MQPILKQFADLSPEDFESHPIWICCHTADYDEPWYENTDEETYRPIKKEEIFKPSDESYLIKARFILNDGTTLDGFFTPQNTNNNEDGISYVQPQIFIQKTRFSFWFGMFKPDNAYFNDFYSKLAKKPEEVFPINYITTDDVMNGGINGYINGFGFVDKEGVKTVK